MKNISQMVDSYASSSLGKKDKLQSFPGILSTYSFIDQIHDLLSIRNGFTAYESSLNVFPFDDQCLLNIVDWNSTKSWKHNYEFDLPQFLCFAENIFGEQFCTCNGYVCQFDPETGNFDQVASSIDDWAKLILDEHNLYTGYSLAHEWQKLNGALLPHERLVPRIPFVCQGEFVVENLTKMDSAKAMKYRANLANQIRNLPDGSEIQFDLMN